MCSISPELNRNFTLKIDSDVHDSFMSPLESQRLYWTNLVSQPTAYFTLLCAIVATWCAIVATWCAIVATWCAIVATWCAIVATWCAVVATWCAIVATWCAKIKYLLKTATRVCES